MVLIQNDSESRQLMNSSLFLDCLCRVGRVSFLGRHVVISETRRFHDLTRTLSKIDPGMKQDLLGGP